MMMMTVVSVQWFPYLFDDTLKDAHYKHRWGQRPFLQGHYPVQAGDPITAVDCVSVSIEAFFEE